MGRREDDFCVVFMTAGGEEEGAGIARALVEKKLAACVNIVAPIRSIYSWKGKVEDEREVLLVAKTRRELFDALRSAVTELHSYEVPEIIALPITAGLDRYLDWVLENTLDK